MHAAGFLVLPIGDMILFGGFFAAGIAGRRRRELHTRLMLLATVALLFAPTNRDCPGTSRVVDAPSVLCFSSPFR